MPDSSTLHWPSYISMALQLEHARLLIFLFKTQKNIYSRHLDEEPQDKLRKPREILSSCVREIVWLIEIDQLSIQEPDKMAELSPGRIWDSTVSVTKPNIISSQPTLKFNTHKNQMWKLIFWRDKVKDNHAWWKFSKRVIVA